jgi:hypothetical protein
MLGLVLLLLAGVAGMSWWQLLQGRERARAVAASACREHGLVLMDDTVVFESVSYRPNRLGGEQRRFALTYGFEFAFRGILHRGGKVWVTPGFASMVLITTEHGDLIEEY